MPTQGPWAESNVCHKKQSPSLCSPLPSCPLERAGNRQRGLANVRGLATGERERERREGGREGEKVYSVYREGYTKRCWSVQTYRLLMRRYTHCLHRDHGLRATCATINNHLLSAHLCLLVRWSGLATVREGWQTSEGWQQERERERGGREGGREGSWSVQTYRLLMRSYTHCLHRDHGLRATCATINNHLLSAHLCLLVLWSWLTTVREGWQTSEGWQQERERERGGRERMSTVCIERATQSVVGVCKHIGSSCEDTHIAYTGTMG